MTPEDKLKIIKSYGKTEVYERTGPETNDEPWMYSITVNSSRFGAIISSRYDELDHIINQTFDVLHNRVLHMALRVERA
jgi:hypothetical protein